VEYRLLGRTGVRVSALAVGAFNFGGPTDEAEARRIIDLAIDAGCNLFDTANVYQDGRSEQILGSLLAGVRDDVLITTKVFNPVGPGPNDRGNSALAVIRECERSLRRLGTDRIDIYFLHRHDPDTALNETLGALDVLVRSGKVRYYGFSTFPTSEDLASGSPGIVPTWRVVEALWISDRRRYHATSCEQVPLNLLEREVEQHLLPLCRTYGLGVFAYSPLAMGALTAAALEGGRDRRFDRWFSSAEPEWRRTEQARNRLGQIAAQAGLPLERLAHAWLRQHRDVTSVLLGPRTAAHLQAALAVPDHLDEDLLRSVDDIVPPGTSLWMRPAEAMHRRRGSGG
jgi:1-deoxyxylulose-5-phosphate synthase